MAAHGPRKIAGNLPYLRGPGFLKKALDDGFTLRDVRRNQWRSLTTDDAIQAALDWLEDEDWLRSEATGGTGPGSGRRTLRYSIHPAIKAKRKGGDA